MEDRARQRGVSARFARRRTHRAAAAWRCAARPRGSPRIRRPLSARAVRWHAPARCDRARARAGPTLDPDGRAVRGARRTVSHPHGPRPPRHLGKDRQDRILHHPQPDGGDLPLRSRAGDESAAWANPGIDRDRVPAATRTRHHWQRGVRQHPQPHLASYRGGATVTRGRTLKVVTIVATLVLWEGIVRLGFVNQIILAAPSDIVAAAAKDGGVFMRAFAVTIAEIIAAIIVAWVLGVVLGVIVGSSHMLAAATAPVLSSIFAIPLIIVYPLLMAWLGIGPLSKIVFGVLSGFFPIALNTIDGVRAIEHRFLVFARSIGASRPQTYARIILPLALPSIVSGLRMGTGLVVIGVIVTEMLASLGGIGYVISYHRTLFDTGHVYFGIFLALLIAVALNAGLTRLNRRVEVWRTREQESLHG